MEPFETMNWTDLETILDFHRKKNNQNVCLTANREKPRRASGWTICDFTGRVSNGLFDGANPRGRGRPEVLWNLL
jgi:hypothetical protein